MNFYKQKITTKPQQMTRLKGPRGYALKISSVYYSSSQAADLLCLFDGDQDPILFKIPGQIDPKPTLFNDTLVKLPLHLYDNATAENEVIIVGEVIQIDSSTQTII